MTGPARARATPVGAFSGLTRTRRHCSVGAAYLTEQLFYNPCANPCNSRIVIISAEKSSGLRII